MLHKFGTTVCSDCGNVYQFPVCCGNRFCVICSGNRTFKVRERMLAHLKRNPPIGRYRTRLVTLTVPNMFDLRAGLRYLIHSFQKLRKTKFWKRLVKGGFYVIEVTMDKRGLWHPHIHAVVSSMFIPAQELQKLWTKSIDRLDSPVQGADVKLIADDKGVFYLTGYLNKPGFPERHLDYVNSCLHRIHMFKSFGTFYINYSAPKPPPAVCPACGSTHISPSRVHYFIPLPELRGLSPPLDPIDFPGVEPRLVDRISNMIELLQHYQSKRSAKLAKIPSTP